MAEKESGWLKSLMESLGGAGQAQKITILRQERAKLGKPRSEGDFPSDDELSKIDFLDKLIKVLQDDIRPGSAGTGTLGDDTKKISRGPR